MANKETNIIKRDKARRYAMLSADYKPWTRQVKEIVENASDEDWGTFVVACALLESAIPRAEVDKVKAQIEAQVEYDRRWEEYQKEAEKRNHPDRFACIAASVLTAVIAYAALYAIATNQILGFTGIGSISALKNAFSVPGLVAFSFLGSLSAGYALGSQFGRFGQTSGRYIFLSCFSGLACVCLCPLSPPIALILAWIAWRTDNAMEPQMVDAFQKQIDYRSVHGNRVYARDPKAPRFVQNAIRLAGIYQHSTDQISDIARDALTRNQADYGAFVVYDALLTEHHSLRRAKEKLQQIDELVGQSNGNEGDATISAADELREAAKETEQTEGGGIVMRGVIASAVVAIAMWYAADTGALFAMLPDPVRVYALNMTLAALCLISVLIGWRSGVRVKSMYGLDLSGKRRASILRPAWFAAWAMLIGVYLLFIFSVG